eukprot:768238-Hanusia_phi.AAC.2
MSSSPLRRQRVSTAAAMCKKPTGMGRQRSRSETKVPPYQPLRSSILPPFLPSSLPPFLPPPPFLPSSLPPHRLSTPFPLLSLSCPLILASHLSV